MNTRTKRLAYASAIASLAISALSMLRDAYPRLSLASRFILLGVMAVAYAVVIQANFREGLDFRGNPRTPRA